MPPLYLVLGTSAAWSAIFDVSTETELRDAVMVASGNGESDSIRLNGNTIELTFDQATQTGGQLLIDVEPGQSLSINNGTITRDPQGPQFRLI